MHFQGDVEKKYIKPEVRKKFHGGFCLGPTTALCVLLLTPATTSPSSLLSILNDVQPTGKEAGCYIDLSCT